MKEEFDGPYLYQRRTSYQLTGIQEHMAVPKPIWKLNNGKGATLCNKCNIIIKEDLTQDLFCEECKKFLPKE